MFEKGTWPWPLRVASRTRQAAGVKPAALRGAVRPLLPEGVQVLGAFQVMLGQPGGEFGSVSKSVVAWTEDEVFVCSASRWKGDPVALLGRMPLEWALLSEEDGAQPWDSFGIVIGGADYSVSGEHSAEAIRFRRAWRASLNGRGHGPVRRTL